MKKYVFYRGINVSDVNQIEGIREKGIIGTEGENWDVNFRECLKSFSEINIKDYSNSNELFPEAETKAIFGCGDEYGAAYYAHIHNKGNLPTIIKFQADIDEFYIDGRDFLYTIFQLWDRNGKNNFSKASQILVSIFGSKISNYFDCCFDEPDSMRRIIYCNYACFDNDIKLAYLNNQQITKGRHNTHFKSSFVIKAPIDKNDIIDIYSPQKPMLLPNIKLEDII